MWPSLSLTTWSSCGVRTGFFHQSLRRFGISLPCLCALRPACWKSCPLLMADPGTATVDRIQRYHFWGRWLVSHRSASVARRKTVGQYIRARMPKIDRESIRSAYDDVRNDSSETTWWVVETVENYRAVELYLTCNSEFIEVEPTLPQAITLSCCLHTTAY